MTSGRYSLSNGHFLIPPHRLYDCAIDLCPGAPLPSSRLYQLSRPGREAMESYISEPLASGLICPSSSLVGAGFFFVKKWDGTSGPCIDYHGLKEITIWNRYLLPLLFTKLDLRNTYHLVGICSGD